MPELLFVYGTLHPERAPAEIAAHAKRLKFLAEATIRGKLEQLPGYPAVRLGPGCDDVVRGALFELPDAPAVLEAFDHYEGFDTVHPAGSLFVRVKVEACLADGRALKCWIYSYNSD